MAKKVLCLEFDNSELRAAILSNNQDKIKIIGFERLPLSNEVIKNGIINNALIEEIIKKILKVYKIKRIELFIGIYNRGIMARFAQFPVVDNEKIEKIVNLQASDYLPISIDEIYLKYITLYQNAEDTITDTLLLACKKEMLDSYLKLDKIKNIQKMDITISSLVLSNYIKSDTSIDEAEVIVNLSKGNGSILINVNKKTYFTRMINVDITDYIDKDVDDSEDIYLNYRDEYFLEIGDEINNSINFYLRQESSVAVNSITITGGMTNIAGLKEYLYDRFLVNVNTYDASDLLDKDSKNEYKKSILYKYAVCIAMGESYFKDNRR